MMEGLTWIVAVCVFTEILLLTTAQVDNMRNLAFNKTCNISSRYAENPITSGNCSAAINGILDTDFQINRSPPNCIHTSISDNSPFWWVDLGQNFSVHGVTIYARNGSLERMKCVRVSLDGREIYTFPSSSIADVTTDIYFHPPQRGQVVNITRNCTSSGDYAPFLNICEVQIWGRQEGLALQCCEAWKIHFTIEGRCLSTDSCNCGSTSLGCANGSWGDDCQYQCSPWCQGSGEDNYCDSDTGTCLKGCMLGYWGDNCTFTCGEGCNGSACNMSDGTCECRPGWESPLCQNCSDGYYNMSNDCQNTCGRGCNDTCSRSDGTCQCQQGWQPPLCQQCSAGYYNVSSDCQNTCGRGCNNTCSRTDGTCLCQQGWEPPLCQHCSAGHYNVSNDCQDTCGEGCNNTCSRTNGTCQCHPGWQPPLCQHCLHGHFNVSNDCHNICGKGCHDTCKSTDGTCQCQTGWESPMCQKCSIGRWGDNCSNSCARGCQNAVCDAVNGTCPCKRGWAAPHCDYCSDNYYSLSSDCQNTCGEGCNNTCNTTDGTCQCRTGWDSPLCQRQSTSEITKTNAPVGAIVGSVIAAAVAVVIVIAILYLRRRQQHKGSRPRLQAFPDKFLSKSRQQLSTDDEESEIESEQSVPVHARKGSKPIAPVKPQMHSKPNDEVVDTNVYNNTDVYSNMFHEQPLSVIASAYSSDPTDENTSASGTNEINLSNESRTKKNSKVHATVQKPVSQKQTGQNTIYENVELKENFDEKSEDSQSQASFKMPVDADTTATDEEEEDVYKTENIYASYQSLEPSSILDDFQKSLLASLASGKLGMEFSEFPKGNQHPHEVASKPENSKKNRFKALCAYDHSRVVLLRPKGDSNTDYINASYIKGCLREKAYIATQGPRSNTVDDLWWMVWQENITQVIMLTSLIEGGKEKCEEYWPPVGTTKAYGHVTVTALKTDTRADFVIRTFVLETKKGGDQRTVSQYHYLVWPDHGVPSTYSLVSFWRYVKARAQGAIPVVHCSAGVGRTGTYIALDIASDLRSRGRDVNIKEIVSRLREDRMLMVQTEEQYKFLHEAILEEHTSRTTRMTFDQFDFTFPDTINIHKESRVDKEFKMVCQMGEFVARPKYTLAASRENMHKNQCKEFLPDDDHLVYLTGYVPGRNQYINAVHMSSFRKRQGLILTQLPLPDTVVDIWRMIDGWDVNTVVSLGHKDQKTSVKNYCRYWPETDKDTLKTGPYSISLTSSSALGDHLTCYNLSLTTKALKIKTVRVLYYDDWKELIPSRISDILQLIDTLESWRVEDDPSPVVVQCSDGMTRSGMFCALYDVINRARHDQEIDVYLSVRQVRTVRQHAITSEVQYRYCYQAAQEYKRQYGVYQNT